MTREEYNLRTNNWVNKQRVFRIYAIIRKPRQPKNPELILFRKWQLAEAKASAWEALIQCHQKRTAETMSFIPF